MTDARRGRSRVRAWLVPGALTLLTIAALVLVGPFSGDPAGEDPGPGAATAPGDAESTAPAKPRIDTQPLTGLRVRGDRSSARRHPVLVLKMDNTGASAPQRGLDRADLVVEELVEGGLTRLAAFFYSDIPGVVGPVRSMRASDIGIVAPVDASMVTSGAASVTIDRIRRAGLDFYNEETRGFSRDPARVAPYDLMADLGVVARLAQVRPTRPQDYLPFAPPGRDRAARTGRPASGVAATFSGSHTTTWRWNGRHYDNVDGYAAEGAEFEADNVLALRVPVGDAGYLDPAGNPVPETRLRGTGAAVLLHDGVVQRGTWAKAGPRSALRLRTAGGTLLVPPGRTWIELVPADAGSVTVMR